MHLHAHAAVCKERGLLTARTPPIKQGQEILNLLEAVKIPEQVAVKHCRGHQKDKSPVTKGNGKADQVANKAAQRPVTE